LHREGADMKMKNILTVLGNGDLMRMIPFLGDWKAFVRWQFLYAVIESGLLDILDRGLTRDEIMEESGVRRADILDALLDLGCALRELSLKNGRYQVRGKRLRRLQGGKGDCNRALIEAGSTYYSDIYRKAGNRLRGEGNGPYLEEAGPIIARWGKLLEPMIRNFVVKTFAGRGELKTLDVGCGSGNNLKLAHLVNESVYGMGIDYDENVVRQAAANMRDWRMDNQFAVAEGDIRTPSTELGHGYDVVTMYNVVYYFTVEERCQVFRNIRSLLRENGELAIVNSFNTRKNGWGTSNLNMAVTSIQGCYPLPRLDETRRFLEEAGFSRITVEQLVPGDAFYGITAK